MEKSKYKDLDFPIVLDVGPLGIKWRGQDIQDPTSSYPDDYEAQFGFSCANCGGSGVNQEPVKHSILCERWYEID